MAYAVDAAIREQNKRLTAGKQGGDDGNDYLHSAAAQKMSLALPEFAHTREVISKFGDVIRVGTPVAIPHQTWNHGKTPSNNPFDSFRSRSPPTHVMINSGISGYQGHKPQAAQWTMPHRTRARRPHRTVQRPCQPVWPRLSSDCRALSRAVRVYTGRADRQSNQMAPFLQSRGVSTEEYPANRPHAPTHNALSLPGGRAALASTQRRPAIGYTGHLRGTSGDATQCFGTSHWRAKAPISRADEALMGFEAGETKGRQWGADYKPPAEREAHQRAFSMAGRPMDPMEC